MQFDHVEVFVPDRDTAQKWYAEVLGFTPVPEYADWAADGPLMIANADGQMIALFVGTPQADAPVRGWRRLALRVDADGFEQFVRTSSRWADPPLRSADMSDHGRSLSVYFTDPFGNPLEVTTYEHAAARRFVESFRRC